MYTSWPLLRDLVSLDQQRFLHFGPEVFCHFESKVLKFNFQPCVTPHSWITTALFFLVPHNEHIRHTHNTVHNIVYVYKAQLIGGRVRFCVADLLCGSWSCKTVPTCLPCRKKSRTGLCSWKWGIRENCLSLVFLQLTKHSSQQSKYWLENVVFFCNVWENVLFNFEKFSFFKYTNAMPWRTLPGTFRSSRYVPSVPHSQSGVVPMSSSSGVG
jgi:hypothetical protein